MAKRPLVNRGAIGPSPSPLKKGSSAGPRNPVNRGAFGSTSGQRSENNNPHAGAQRYTAEGIRVSATPAHTGRPIPNYQHSQSRHPGENSGVGGVKSSPKGLINLARGYSK